MRLADLSSLRSRLLLAVGALTTASLQHGRARADEPTTKTECLSPPEGSPCPSDKEAIEQIAKRDPSHCPSLVHPGTKVVDGQCCYEVRYDECVQSAGCSYSGRPLVIEGRPLEGGAQRLLGWRDERLGEPDLGRLSADERELLALHWARIGAAEYASIAGFSRFALALMASGAPADLIVGAQKAALDEVQHAQLAFALASAFAGTPIGPSALPLPPALPIPRSLRELGVSVAEEGCSMETLSACLLAEALAHAKDPAARAALARMRRDEERHAALAWQALRWVLAQDPSLLDPLDAALRAATERLTAHGFAHPAGLERYGLLLPSQAEACRVAAIDLVIEPCRRALLG